MTTTLQEFIAGLTETLTLPDIYRKARILMDNPNAKIADFVQLVQIDTSLALAITQFASHEFFGFDRKTEDLYQAISSIGIGQLHDLLLSNACMRMFNHHRDQTFNFSEFWRQGIKRGIAACAIAKFCQMPANNRFFTVGLLLDIGHAAMFAQAPDLTFQSLQASHQQKRPIDEVEREHFGFDYCQLGAALLHEWQLPDFYSQIIAHYLYPARAKRSMRDETELAYLSHHLCTLSEAPTLQGLRLLDDNEQLLVRNIIIKEIADNLDDLFVMLNTK